MYVICVNNGEDLIGDFRDEAGAETHLTTDGWVESSDKHGKLWTKKNWWIARVIAVKRSLSELCPLPLRVREWFSGPPGDTPFSMPSGAGTLTGREAIAMLDKGISRDSDYTVPEIIQVFVQAYEEREGPGVA